MCEYLNKSFFALDVGPRKPLCIVATSFSSSFLTTLCFRLVSVAGVTHKQLRIQQSFIFLRNCITFSSAIKRVVVFYLVRRSPVSLKPPVFLGFRCCYVCSDGICENLPLASSFCPGHLSVAGTCSSNMGPWLSHLLTQSVRFARLIWLVRVCTFLRRQFKLMHYTPESTSFVQPNLQS